MSAMQRGLERAGRLGLSGKLALIAVLVLLGVLWLSSTRHGGAKPAIPAADVAAPLELAPADVSTVTTAALSRELPVSGSLSPVVQTTINSKVAGDLLDMPVLEGQSVKKGQVLAHVDTRYIKATLDSQDAALQKARADLALAKLNKDNSEAMLKEHYISQNAYDSAASTYEADLATVKAAEAQVSLARLSWDDAVVRAPFDGTVVRRLVQAGQRVNVDDGLLLLVDLSRMQFQVLAPASEVPSVHVGQTAHFTVGGFGDRQFVGQVDRINPMVEEGSRSISLYLSVPNPDGALRGGMFGQGSLVLDRSAPAPTIPVAALRSEAGVSYVVVFADGKLTRRNVTLGLRSEDQGSVEIKDGLKPGEQVLLAKLDDFKEGTAAVLNQPAASAAAPAAGH